MERRDPRQTDLFQSIPTICAAGPFKGYARLDGISLAAQRDRGLVFNNLLHHLSLTNLKQAYRKLDGKKACGIDRITKTEYGRALDENLGTLHKKIKGGGWYPKPSRHVLIPKRQGGTRTLSVGCLEDKIVQNLTAKILEAIYEPIFSPRSFGFRPKRGTHQALARLYKDVEHRTQDCVVVETDFEKFFDSIDHEKLMELIQIKISDPFFLRHLRRLLRNSILATDGKLVTNERGTPQGSPVSPILANICLHYALDTWFEERWAGQANFVRYADDAVFTFKNEEDANQFVSELKTRMAEYGVRLNTEKTQTTRFDSSKPKGVVSFAGFILYWGKHRSKPKLKVKTASKTLARCIQTFKEWMKAVRNRYPLERLWEKVTSRLRGHFNYFGVTFNEAKLNHFYFVCIRLVYRWLNRRSQKRSFSWDGFIKRVKYSGLPIPQKGKQLLVITNGLGSRPKPKPKSRMRKLRKSGSVRSAGWQHPVFT